MSGEDYDGLDRADNDGQKPDKMFTLKKWNAVAMWSWDVECDTCAICRVQVMDVLLKKGFLALVVCSASAALSTRRELVFVITPLIKAAY